MTITRINPQEWDYPVKVLSPSIERGIAPSSDVWEEELCLCDKRGNVVGYIRSPFMSDGREGVGVETKRTVNGVGVYHGLHLYIDPQGNRTVTVHDQQAWRNGLGITSADVRSGISGVGNVAIVTQNVWTYGKVASLFLAIRPSAAIAANTQVATLGASWRPLNEVFLLGNVHEHDFLLRANGEISTRNALNANYTYYMSATYVMA